MDKENSWYKKFIRYLFPIDLSFTKSTKTVPMSKITLEDYWRGRDTRYSEYLTDDIVNNAKNTLERINKLLDYAEQDGVIPAINPLTKTHCASGWRPPAVNDATSNAAKRSKHLTGEACDIADHKDRRLARWCLQNIDKLVELDLYMEDPQWTVGKWTNWVHLQTKPPGSKRRVFIPSSSPPRGSKLPEQLS